MTTRRARNEPPSFGSRAVFVGTSAYYALADPRETTDRAAQAILERLTREHWRHHTTNFILAEFHALLLRRRGRVVAGRVLFELDHSATIITRVIDAFTLTNRQNP